VGNYQCKCKPGYTGKHCNQGNLLNTHYAFKLSLIRFTGRCTMLCFVLFLLPNFKSRSKLILTLDYFIFWDVNECNSTPCKNGGTCINTVGNYECKCKPGYTGKHCNQGNLLNTHYTFILSLIPSMGCCAMLCFVLFLLPDFKSRELILTLVYFIFWDVNECNSTPCKNGGTCINTVGNYECKCKPQYTGKHCDQGKHTSYNDIKYSYENVFHSQVPFF